jgi:uncharacterized membrane protein
MATMSEMAFAVFGIFVCVLFILIIAGFGIGAYLMAKARSDAYNEFISRKLKRGERQ